MLTRLIAITVAAFACWCLGWLPVEAWLCAVPMFLFPSCVCCGTTCDNCTAMTATVQIDVSGFTDGTASHCDPCFNTSFVLSRSGLCNLATTPGTECRWREITGCANFTYACITVAALGGTDYEITGNIGGASGSYNWSSGTISGKPDCSAWSSYSLAYSSNTDFGGVCAQDTSPILLTAL